MANRMLDIAILDRRLNPAEAELWIGVRCETTGPDLQVRGRLHGPRCLYATTIEVAYPLRQPPHHVALLDADRVWARVVIPEPSLWEPESPFRYEGPVELWQDERCLDRRQVRHGLRQVALTPRGLRINNHPIAIRGEELAEPTVEAVTAARTGGLNTLLVSGQTDIERLAVRADEVGILLLVEVPRDHDPAVLRALARHPSCLGIVVSPPSLQNGHGHPEEITLPIRLPTAVRTGSQLLMDFPLMGMGCVSLASEPDPVESMVGPPMLGWIRPLLGHPRKF